MTLLDFVIWAGLVVAGASIVAVPVILWHLFLHDDQVQLMASLINVWQRVRGRKGETP